MNASASLRSASPCARFSGLPIPPSVNAIWQHSPSGVYNSAPYREWKRTAGWQIKLARQVKIHGPYQLTLRVQTGSTRCDIGNLEKAASDLLQDMGVIQNDRYARRIVIEWSDAADLLEIEVRAA